MAEHKDLDRKAIKLAKQVVRMCTEAGSGHPSSGLSLLHLVTALMYREMKYDPKNPWNTGADRLVLSEGHAVPVVYAAYCDLGGLVGPMDQASELRFSDALTLRDADSVLDGHPNPAIGFPFFDAATGSLGMGPSVSAGLALAARLDGGSQRFFCICGDGESREGQVWEALDFIKDQKLTAVKVIFNCNKQGQSDPVSEQQSPEVLEAKLKAYGFEVHVIDGHDWDQVFEALRAEPASADSPIAIVAKTVKGWGVKELQAQGYHGKPISSDDLENALADLDAKAEELGVAEMQDPEMGDLTTPVAVSRPEGEGFSAGSFADALKAAGMESALESRKLSTRRAWGAALGALGKDERIVSIDGDVKNSTFAKVFADTFPDRYFEARIAEQNMISTAVGLSAAGRVPFASSFAKFLARGLDQVELAAITNANIKIVGSHAGVSLAADGPSQMAMADLAFMRAYAHATREDGQPAVRVFHPCDAISAFRLTELMANCEGMAYMRTHRPDVPFVYEEDDEFSLDGFRHLIDGEDLAIVASGYTVHLARKAIEMLEEKAGLSASLIDVYALPLATEEILRIGDDCRGQILVVEDNYVGGVADEIAAAAAKSDYGVMVESMHVTRIPKSAKTPEEIMQMVELAPENIVRAAQKMFDSSEA